MTRFRTLLPTAALAAAAVLAPSAQAPQVPAQQPPTFRSGIDLVAVDVTVLARNGRPVATLKAEDFTLQVDGAPRPIVSARLIEARAEDPAGAAARPVPPVAAPGDAAARGTSTPPGTGV
jgi:hypothetical protein